MQIKGDVMKSLAGEFTHNKFKDDGYVFFKPLLENCLALEGNGELEDENTTFVAVVVKNNKDDEAYIITTVRGHDRKSLEIQNIETLLKASHYFSKVQVQYSTPKDIHAILSDANTDSAKNKSDDEEQNTAAQQDLENIVLEAVVNNASDIHFYIYADRAEAVFRIDGVFKKRTPLGRSQANNIIAAGLNTKSEDYRSVTDDREMADVRLRLVLDVPEKNSKGRTKSKREKIDLRTSKSGALEGAHTVMRVIRNSQDSMKTLDGLLLDTDLKELLLEAVETPSGIIIVTGPTGSGKSTTLAALYEEIDVGRKLILLEDPVEYKIHRKNTVQKPVYPDLKGQGFNDYLENALRQDPDIIGISEMRSKAVASSVIKSALTGHLMLSTLHTNDAIGAIDRLIDEGISAKVLATRHLIQAIVAQRLIPTLCNSCKVKSEVEGFTNAFVTNEEGCGNCDYTGTKGRVLIAEVVMIDRKGREFIVEQNLAGLEHHIRSHGWKGMSDRARLRIEQGILDPFEAKRHITDLFGKEENFQYADICFDKSTVTKTEIVAA